MESSDSSRPSSNEERQQTENGSSKFWNKVMSDDPAEILQEVANCSVCETEVPTAELDAHLCTDHLDYYPFSCGHCCHFMPTEELAKFHAHRKNHLPMKIRESIVLAKEKELRKLLHQSMSGGTREVEIVAVVTGRRSSTVQKIPQIKSEVSSSAPSPTTKQSEPYTQSAQFLKQRGAIDAIAANLSDHAGETSGDDAENSNHGSTPAGESAFAKRRSTPTRSSARRQSKSPWFGSRRRKRQNPRKSSLEDGGTEIKKMATGKAVVKEEVQEVMNEAKPDGSMKTREEIIRESIKSSLTCKQCRNVVGGDRMGNHVKGHLQTRKQKGCRYCKYTGNSTPGIKIHIIRTHGKDLGNDKGVVDVPDCSFSEMSQMCFGMDLNEDAVRATPTPSKEEYYNESKPAIEAELSIDQSDSISPLARNRLQCNICKQVVPKNCVKGHVNKHVQTRPLFSCNYCGFKGRSAMAVRVHISWRHTGKSAKLGVKSLGTIDYEKMRLQCFSQEPTFEDPSLVSKTTNILRPYARRASKTIGSSDGSKGMSANQRPPTRSHVPMTSTPANQGEEGEAGRSPGVTRIGTMPSGRICRYMRCMLCGSEVVDALVSAHVYQTHLRAAGAVKCPYCEFSVYYAIAEVKKHITKKHVGQKVVVEDNRASLQDQYLEWRTRCFPNVGIDWRSLKKARLVDSSNSGDSPLSMVSMKRNSVNGGDCFATPLPRYDSRRGSGQLSGTEASLSLTGTGEEQNEDGRVNEGNYPAQNGVSHKDISNIQSYRIASASKPQAEKRYTAAHYKNSLKSVCNVCGVEVTNLWKNRHIWKHLDMDGKPRYKCEANGCVFETYLLRTLDTHVNHVHENGKTAADVGYADRGVELQGMYKDSWMRCFNEEINESMMSADFLPIQPESTGGKVSHSRPNGFLDSFTNGQQSADGEDMQECQSPPKNVFVSLGFGDSSTGSMDPYSEEPEGDSPPLSDGMRSHVTGVRGLRSEPQEAWCQQCKCSVPSPEIEDHVWYVHLDGNFPFRCQLCQSSFVTVNMMEEHWTLSHADRSLDTSKLTELPEAREIFETKLIECFPEMANELIGDSSRDPQGLKVKQELVDGGEKN